MSTAKIKAAAKPSSKGRCFDQISLGRVWDSVPRITTYYDAVVLPSAYRGSPADA